MKEAQFGLNLFPDEAPYNIKIFTQLLEYCAVALNPFSTQDKWVADFERTHDAKFGYEIYGSDEFYNVEQNSMALDLLMIANTIRTDLTCFFVG